MPNESRLELNLSDRQKDDGGSFPGSKLWNWLTFSSVLVPAALVVAFVVIWFGRRDRIPKHVVVKTAAEGSSYEVFGRALSDAINEQAGREIIASKTSSGSGENIASVSGDRRFVTMAMYQGGSVALPSDVMVVAPLYREVVHVLVKKDLLDNLETVNQDDPEMNHDLLRELLIVQKKEIHAGKEDSGMRFSAMEIMDHYGLSTEEVTRDVSFSDDESADIVISTTGMFGQKMEDRLRRSDYRILSLQARAIAHRWPYFVEHDIPRGFYRDQNSGPIPSRPARTIATTAFLVVHRETSPKLVKTCLSALYKAGLGKTTVHLELIPRDDARKYLHGMPVHATADEFYSPLDIGYLTTVMESIIASKDLMFAFFAGIYLIWSLRRRSQERRRLADIKANRVRLDEYVDETIAIESAQIDVVDPARLEVYLDEVTRIKLRALDELTDEALRDDRVFSIFLMQCANLISKIQLKIITYSSSGGDSYSSTQTTDDEGA